VRQEAWGFLLAHFAIRALMHEAALGALPRASDPDRFAPALRPPPPASRPQSPVPGADEASRQCGYR
jgi:hypothetical protein